MAHGSPCLPCKAIMENLWIGETMDKQTIKNLEKERTARNIAYTIDRMKDKAWKISQTGKKGEREEIAIELVDNLDALLAEIRGMIV